MGLVNIFKIEKDKLDKMQPRNGEILSLKDYPKEPVILDHLPVQYMQQARFVPLALHADVLEVAMAEPDDFQTIDALQLTHDLKVVPFRGRAGDILETIDRLYGTGSQSLEHIIEEADKSSVEAVADLEDDADHLRDMASEAPIIRLVNRLILNAVELKASDIHFEPYEKDFSVRYRIDGLLNEVESPPKRLQAAVISRIKIMAKLDIAERRLPQDGRVKLKILDKEIDFRVSTIPTLFGESLVMRILDRENSVLELKSLGFGEDLLSQFAKLIAQPYGMILVTGPTGSGKTSSLYATLARLNSPEKKILTLEDPVEYQLRGINQIQVNPKIGLTFSSGLRTIVRHDPDIILVGEIRDRETAQTAVQSALTGHLLFSTLHTNNAPGAITRLLDMEVENFLLSSTLLGILAQRLVRVICPDCKQEVTPDPRLLAAMGVTLEELGGHPLYEGAGCEACRFTGFKGRTGIFELIVINEDIRREILHGADAGRLRSAAAGHGFAPLRRDGWRKVLEGVTTLPEVLRVTLEGGDA